MYKRRVEEIQEEIRNLLKKYLRIPIEETTHLIIRNQLNAYLQNLYNKHILIRLLHSEVRLCDSDHSKMNINFYYFDLKRNIKVYIDDFEDVMDKGSINNIVITGEWKI